MKVWGFLGFMGLALVLTVGILYINPKLKIEYALLYKYSLRVLVIWGIIFAGYYVSFLLKK
jgi:hypothetical protein